MPNFVATITMRDDYNRLTRKKLECTTDVLADAETEVGAYLTSLAGVTDLGVDLVTYSSKDTGDAFALTAGANVDTGATMRGRVASGEIVTVKIPGFKASLVGANGQIDPEDVTVAAFLAHYEAAGNFTLSDGEKVTEWVGGELDR